ncbi:hypothetical protein QQS21_003133 [Conoideocrella luteorostrata]|uniref:Uncharacterized protein n=1 Tax=Conoideocrella luteorostrata TaxID=1105319 RepID=A0AAJ0G0Q1_9HYPO|nr:hypothetical protein QQS21_003133 [Conoideocrella luteorostrata]
MNNTDIKTNLAPYSSIYLLNRVNLGVYARDQVLRGNVNDGVPARKVWKAAAKSAFHGSKCAAGGISRSYHGRAAPMAMPRNAPSGRLSESVDTTPVEQSEMWEAVYNQKAEFFKLAIE